MGVPESKGRVDSTFLKLLSALQTQAEKQATAARTGAARVWQIPPSLKTALSDIGGITKGFDRDELNKLFSSLIEDSSAMGTAGDVVGVKIQVDYVAAMERAFRARHASPLRCLAHAAARRKGHGDSAGIFSDASGVTRFVADAIQAGRGQTGYTR